MVDSTLDFRRWNFYLSSENHWIRARVDESGMRLITVNKLLSSNQNFRLKMDAPLHCQLASQRSIVGSGSHMNRIISDHINRIRSALSADRGAVLLRRGSPMWEISGGVPQSSVPSRELRATLDGFHEWLIALGTRSLVYYRCFGSPLSTTESNLLTVLGDSYS